MIDVALRAKIEAAIDRLVAVLDAMDAADEDREPSLGAPENDPTRHPYCGDQTYWAQCSDRELEHDGREPEHF